MSGWILTWKPAGAGRAPVDGTVFRPDRLGGLARGALAATSLGPGARGAALGACCRITGRPGPRLVLRGFPPLDRLGEGMREGELVIEGPVGDRLGAGMRGGLIRAGEDVGERAGGPAPGARRGMSGGVILVGGRAGAWCGETQRGGLVVVGGGCGAFPGHRMIAGTIVIGRGPGAPAEEGAAGAPGLGMRRGTLVLADPDAPPVAGAHLAEDGQVPAAGWVIGRLLRRELDRLGFPAGAWEETEHVWRLLRGDTSELNRGEIWQLRKRAASRV